jgi:hypothetical protein
MVGATHQMRYGRYARCADCVRAGDLVELARASPAGVVGAARLAAAQEDSPGAPDLTRRAHQVIAKHMHVGDDDKLKAAEAFEARIRYEGHCCAVCGVRDPSSAYVEVFFSRSGRSADVVLEGGGGGAGSGGRERARLRPLPSWIRACPAVVDGLRALRTTVYVEHASAPDDFVRVSLSAARLRHIMRVCVDDPAHACALCEGAGCYAHLVEEAVRLRCGGDEDVASMYVCEVCERSFGRGSGRRSNDAPGRSIARGDYGRRCLTQGTYLDCIRGELLRQEGRGGPDAAVAQRLQRLPETGWRLPVATELEKALLAEAYLHVMCLKVACPSPGGSHAVLRKSTVYFPLSLVDSEDTSRVCAPWASVADAVDALRIAVQRIPLVFVGPDDAFERLKRSVFSMSQMRLRPKVVFTLIKLRHLFRGGVSVLELADLECALNDERLHSFVAKKTVWSQPSGPANDKGDDVDHAHVRSDRGLVNATDGEVEEEPVAGCTDASNAAKDALHGCARMLRRGAQALDDYAGQSGCLYKAHFSLFPTGEGLEPDRVLSRERVRHLMLFYDCRFSQDLALIFSLADTIVRHGVNRSVHVQVRKTPAAMARVKVIMEDSNLRARLRAACRDPQGDEAVALLEELMPMVNMTARQTPYTDASRSAFLGTLFAHHRCMGPSSHFISVAPDDVRDLNAIRDALPFRGVGVFPHAVSEGDLSEAVANLRAGSGRYTQARLWQSVVANPVAVTVHFHRKVVAMNECLLGIDNRRCQTCPYAARPKGLLGRLRGGALVKECNGRKSQHVHSLLFGSIMPMFVSLVAAVPSLREAVLRALDTQVRADLPWVHHCLDRLRHFLRARKAPLAITGNGVTNDARGVPEPSGAQRSRRRAVRRAQDPDDTAAWRASKLTRLRERGELVAMDHNRHRHSASCRKGVRGESGCRFCVPFAHNIDRSRCIQLRSVPPDPGGPTRPSDIRWCGFCVAGGHARAGDFTAAEVERVKQHVVKRKLFYEQVPISRPPAQRRPQGGEGEAPDEQQSGRGDGAGATTPSWLDGPGPLPVTQRRCRRRNTDVDHSCGVAHGRDGAAVAGQARPAAGGVAPLAGPGAGTDESTVLGRLRGVLGADSRCLVVEVRRPSPPDGAPPRAPTTVAGVLGLLQSMVGREESLHAASFAADEVVRAAGSEEELEKLLVSCRAHCDNSLVAQYCEAMSASLECNTAIYHLGAGTSARAASTYFAKYEVKSQYACNADLLVVISAAHDSIERYGSTADDAGTLERRSKHLVQRVLNTGVERSATEAAMVALNQPAEIVGDSLVYVNGWDLAVEACALIGVSVPSASTGTDGVGVGDATDTRTRNRLAADSDYRSVLSVRRYTVGDDVVFASAAQHYMYRHADLRHLNAFEFFQMYDVRKGTGASAGRGRQPQPRFPFLCGHPLRGTYAAVRRAKFRLPVLSGGRPPQRPSCTRGGAPARVLARYSSWAVFYSALLVPWGVCGTAGPHFRPALDVVDFVHWWASAEECSLEAATRVEMRAAARRADPMRRLSTRVGGGAAVAAHRRMWDLRTAYLDTGLVDVEQDDVARRDVFEYRLFVLENVTGAFEARPKEIDLANTHRAQSRALWGEDGVVRPGRLWGADEVYDSIRIAMIDREMQIASRGGRFLSLALGAAARAASLTGDVRTRLFPPARQPASASTSDADPDAAPGGSIETAASVSVAPGAPPTWLGSRLPRGFDERRCERLYAELIKPAAAATPSQRSPVGSHHAVGGGQVDDLCLHASQQLVVQRVLDRVRSERGGVARGEQFTLCMGPAGSGKSTMIHAVRDGARRDGLGVIVVTGYTGVCCAPFLSSTLLSLCNLSTGCLRDTDPTHVELLAFRTRFCERVGTYPESIAGLVIDEISFLRPEVLGRVSRLFGHVRDRADEPFGGLALLLAGHLAQLPPVKAAGTWFYDLLMADRRSRGDATAPAPEPREQTRNFRVGLDVLRRAARLDLTHNFRAHEDPEFAQCLLGLCQPTCDTAVVSYLQGLRAFDPAEARWRFGPFATLSNDVRHLINCLKVKEFGRLHRLPVVRWRWATSTSTTVSEDIYEAEPGMWGYYCEGAPAQVTISANPARGVANGTCAILAALRFSRVPPVVAKAMQLSGVYDGRYDDRDAQGRPTGFLTVDRDLVTGVVLRVSKAKWHDVDLAAEVAAVLPALSCARAGVDASGMVALPLVHKQSKEHRLTSTRAALAGVTKVAKRPCTYDLAFAVTDYKLQGLTLDHLVVVVGEYPRPLRHSLSSMYVMLSRVRRSSALRVLEAQSGSVQGLAGSAMRQRPEIAVFETCYDRHGRYDAGHAVRQYRALDRA